MRKGGLMENYNISIRNVSLTFKGENIHTLNNISTELSHGKIIAFIGESGSGKSVLGKTIVGLQNEAHCVGEIGYCQQNLLSLSDSELRKYRGKDIFFMPQDPVGSLNPSMTIGEQLLEGIEFHHDVSSNVAKERVKSILEQLGLQDIDTLLKWYPHQLSGGMAQRILCAMACSLQAKWLLVDEPTKGLDALSRKETISLFKQVKETTHCGMVMITHDMQLVRHMADYLVILKDGAIICQGTKEEILVAHNPYVQELLYSQISVWRQKNL